VNPETPEYNPTALIPYMKALGVEYHVLSKPIIEMAKVHMDPKKASICAFCSRMKRGMLYSCMREHGFNVLVLGQHLDDFAESFLMSAIHNGLLRTMKANYWVQQEDVRVCRPLLYVRESQAALFAKENQLPIIADNCPACFSAPKERHKFKLLLASLEFDYPQVFSTLLRTMRPLYSLETAMASEQIAAEAHDDEDEPHRPAAGGKAAASRGPAGKIGRGGSGAGPALPIEEDDMGAEVALTDCGAAAGVEEYGATLCCEAPAVATEGAAVAATPDAVVAADAGSAISPVMAAFMGLGAGVLLTLFSLRVLAARR